MEVIAINKKENIRIIKCGDFYVFQTKVILANYWMNKEETKQEWLASKWITDNNLKISTDYPTIDEIRNKQKGENR